MKQKLHKFGEWFGRFFKSSSIAESILDIHFVADNLFEYLFTIGELIIKILGRIRNKNNHGETP